MSGKRIVMMIMSVMLCLLLIYAVHYFTQQQKYTEPLNNSNTETNIPLIGKRTYYDMVFLGTSHARIFSRFQNHKRVEQTLDKTFINLSQGYERGGAKSQQMYFLYFFDQLNFANTLVYFVDPFIFYRKKMDANPELYINEPFDHDFYNILKENDAPKDSINFYLTKDQKGLKPTTYPEFHKEYQETQVKVLKPEQVQERIAFLYADEYNKKDFNQVLSTLLMTFQIARGHGMRVIVIIPTTLLPEQSGDRRVWEALKKESEEGTFEFYNFSQAITETSYYYDTDHLNTEGVLLFTEKYLKPILDKK